MSEKDARARGRPVSMSPRPRIDASPEALLRAMFDFPLKEDDTEQGNLCSQCGRQIVFPEILHEDGT